LLRGPTKAVRHFADALVAERGARHGQLNLIAVEVTGRETKYAHADRDAHAHSHDAHGHLHPHVHLKPRR
jgi:CopG family transcriptional regulator, nickel-responsive regulator